MYALWYIFNINIVYHNQKLFSYAADMDAVKQRFATTAVKKMAQRGAVLDPLPTPHPVSPGELKLQ